ncbi:hypothetical protein SAMN05421849_2244 [Pontibaca methylaminivorans]|uniref:Dihydroorotate dehydrogenase n=2 Tax=Pontibaca methylaminivorans TaxID=515897 RepID=A0A1R3X2X5_9RHOB|nr:hypothetical protein SAMN05421849_2244 [Pontibaca methylaminivorans]
MDREMTELDALLRAARQAPADLPEALESRILRDAARVQAGRRSPVAVIGRPRRQPERREGLWSRLHGALGGWPALGGLAAASVAGLWIGLAPPSGLPDPVWLLGESAQEALVLFAGDDLALAMLEDQP